MDFSAKSDELADMVNAYGRAMERKNFEVAARKFHEWKQAMYHALEGAYNKGYEIGDFGMQEAHDKGFSESRLGEDL